MFDMGAIKGLQATFNDIGSAEVAVNKEAEQGVAFGRKVTQGTSGTQGTQDAAGIEANNKAIMGSVLGQLKGAGASSTLLKFAEQSFGLLDQSKPLTGRDVSKSMEDIRVFAHTQENEQKFLNNKAGKFFDEKFPATLQQLGQDQGHDSLSMDKQTAKTMQKEFVTLCKQTAEDTGLPVSQGQAKEIMTNIAQRAANLDTHKTLCDACAVLRGALDEGLSPSEMAFHEKAAMRGMDVSLDGPARSMINRMWKAESQQVFMGVEPHKPAGSEIEDLLDKVLDKFFDQVAQDGPPKAEEPSSTSSSSPSNTPFSTQEAKTAGKEKKVDDDNTPFSESHHIDTSSTSKKKKTADTPDTATLKTEIPLEPKDSAKSKAAPEATSDAKSKTKLEDEVKSEPKPESKTEQKTETKTKTRIETRIETEIEKEIEKEIEPEVKTEAKAEPKTASPSQTDVETKPSNEVEKKDNTVVAGDKPNATVDADGKPVTDPELRNLIRGLDQMAESKEIADAIDLAKLQEELDPNPGIKLPPEQSQQLARDIAEVEARLEKL